MHCNISVFGGTVDVESVGTCNYINYHIAMLIVCGPASIVFTCMAVAMILYYGEEMNGEQQDTFEGYSAWAIVSFLLTAGFEGSFALLVVLFYLSMLLFSISKCLKKLISLIHPRSNAVAAVIVTEEHHLVGIPSANTVPTEGAAVIIPGNAVVETHCFCC
jgi:hypothetical protein